MKERYRVRKSDAASTTDAAVKPEGAPTNRLTGISVNEVSIVDRAANQRKYLVVKDAPGVPPPAAHAPPPPPAAPPAAALQISPELKAKVVGILKAAQDKLTGIAKALETAVETPGAVAPPALVEAFTALGTMFRIEAAPPAAPAPPPAPAAKDETLKAGKKISAARLAQLVSAKTALDSILAEVAENKDDESDDATATGSEKGAAKKSDEPAAPPPAAASTELAEIQSSIASLAEMLGKMTLVFEGQNQRIDSLAKSRGESRQVDLDKAAPKAQPVVWDMDMAKPMKTVQ